MKVLITGGSGFIGSQLAKRCQTRGDDVVILAQENTEAERSNLRSLRAQGYSIVLGGITDPDIVMQATEGCKQVYHLAAAQHEANKGEEHFRRVNVDGTRNVLEASLASGVERFVHGSTIGVYGVDQQGQLDEQSSKNPDNIYGKTKLEGEKLVLSYGDKLPVSIIRISETYGPGDRRLLKLYKGIKDRRFFVIGSGQNKHQLIFVDDLIDGMFLVATKDSAIGEIFVLAGKEVLSTDEMVVTIADVLQVDRLEVKVPMWPFYILAILMESTLKPLGIQPPLHRRRLDFFKKTLLFSPGKSKSLLGFESKTSFRKGSEITVKWYQKQGLI